MNQIIHVWFRAKLDCLEVSITLTTAKSNNFLTLT